MKLFRINIEQIQNPQLFIDWFVVCWYESSVYSKLLRSNVKQTGVVYESDCLFLCCILLFQILKRIDSTTDLFIQYVFHNIRFIL